MPITDEQREARKLVVGGSDVAIIMGCETYKTRHDLWLEKTGKLEPSNVTNEAMELGNELEPMLLDWVAAKFDEDMPRNINYRHAELPMAANLDAVLIHPGFPPRKDEIADIQAKTCGMTGGRTDYREIDGWWIGFGEPGTDEVPDSVIYQVHAEMMCVGPHLEIAYVPTLPSGRGRQMFQVERNVDICDMIAESVRHFWEEHVQRDIPPEHSQPTWTVAKLMRRTPDKVVRVGWGNVKRLQLWRAKKRVADKKCRELQGTIAGQLGDAEFGVFGDKHAGAVKMSRTKIVAHTRKASERTELRFMKKGVPDGE